MSGFTAREGILAFSKKNPLEENGEEELNKFGTGIRNSTKKATLNNVSQDNS
jgi:hypothetical protein